MVENIAAPYAKKREKAIRQQLSTIDISTVTCLKPNLQLSDRKKKYPLTAICPNIGGCPTY